MQPIPLSEATIQTALNKALNTPTRVQVFHTIDSTNRFLRNQPRSETLTCCLAEQQTNGRGRFGRVWDSPEAGNIYCSLRFSLPSEQTQLSGLSLIISLAMHDVLRRYTSQKIQIKWPNDLLFNHKKLAGTLIEILTDANHTDLIIGMGINIHHAEKDWCALSDITDMRLDRNQIIIELILTVQKYLKILAAKRFSAFKKHWQQHDYLYQKNITLTNPNGIFEGEALSIDDAGCLLIKNKHGKILRFSSGDTTLAQSNL